MEISGNRRSELSINSGCYVTNRLEFNVGHYTTTVLCWRVSVPIPRRVKMNQCLRFCAVSEQQIGLTGCFFCIDM